MENIKKAERLKEISNKIGNRHTRKLRKFSDGFNEKFNFFLKCYRNGIMTFPGDIVDVTHDVNAVCAKEGFRLYDDGYFKIREIKSRHNNILKAVIIAKKSFGMHVDMWSDGIAECLFTFDELMETFYEKNIIVPESFVQDFKNRIQKKKMLYWEKVCEEIEKSLTPERIYELNIKRYEFDEAYEPLSISIFDKLPEKEKYEMYLYYLNLVHDKYMYLSVGATRKIELPNMYAEIKEKISDVVEYIENLRDAMNNSLLKINI